MLEVDSMVGRLLASLETLGVAEDTLVYLASDHGGDYWQSGDQGGWNGGFRCSYFYSYSYSCPCLIAYLARGGKSNGALEGGVRVPGFVRWPGRITPGTTVQEPTR